MCDDIEYIVVRKSDGAFLRSLHGDWSAECPDAVLFTDNRQAIRHARMYAPGNSVVITTEAYATNAGAL